MTTHCDFDYLAIVTMIVFIGGIFVLGTASSIGNHVECMKALELGNDVVAVLACN